jgi:hypothetical protein
MVSIPDFLRKIVNNPNNNYFLLPSETYHPFTITFSQLMLCKEITEVYSENITKHTETLCV